MPVQKRAEETRERVLQAAASVFADVGYRGAKVQDVAAAAGLTQGAVYFHFGSKTQLAAAIIERQHELSIAAGREQLKNATSGIEGMIALSGGLARQIVTSKVVQAGLRMSTESVHELREIAEAPYVAWISTCRLFLEDAQSAGQLVDGLNIEAASNVIISAFSGTQFVSVALSGSTDLEARLIDMWTLLLPGILKSSKRSVIDSVGELISGEQTMQTELGNDSCDTVDGDAATK